MALFPYVTNSCWLVARGNFGGKEKSQGKTVLLIDVSDSMDAPLSGRSELMRMDVACLLAMIAREMFADVTVMTFSNALHRLGPLASRSEMLLCSLSRMAAQNLAEPCDRSCRHRSTGSLLSRTSSRIRLFARLTAAI